MSYPAESSPALVHRWGLWMAGHKSFLRGPIRRTAPPQRRSTVQFDYVGGRDHFPQHEENGLQHILAVYLRELWDQEHDEIRLYFGMYKI